MFEVSTLLFTLLVEGFIVSLIVISVMLFLLIKRKRRDTAAARKLVAQIKQQSKVRLEETGSFLNEKYRFEGKGLEKAVQKIDKSEKRFIQKVINMYLKRDSHALSSMDACMAELIETYKEMSPVMPDAEALAEMSSGSSEQVKEMEELQEVNEKLSEELKITKETMGNMISEFGNMFGGGVEHQLENEEVLDKFNETMDPGYLQEEDNASVNEAEVAIENESVQEATEPVVEEKVDDDNIEQSADIQEQDDDIQLAESIDEDKLADPVESEEKLEDLIDHDDLMEDISNDESEDGNKDEADDDKKKDQKAIDEVFDEGIDDLLDSIDLSEDP